MTWLIALLETTGLNWLWGKISGLVGAWLEQRKAKAEIEAKNKADREKEEKANTKQERDDAAKDLIDHF